MASVVRSQIASRSACRTTIAIFGFSGQGNDTIGIPLEELPGTNTSRGVAGRPASTATRGGCAHLALSSRLAVREPTACAEASEWSTKRSLHMELLKDQQMSAITA